MTTDTAWADVPVKKRSVVLNWELKPLEVFYISRGTDSLGIYFLAPAFVNALPVSGNIHGLRRRRKEFREHVERYRYRLPPAWEAMPRTQADTFIVWNVQSWAHAMRRTFYRDDDREYYGRFRVTVVESLAQYLRITDEDADEELAEFDRLNAVTKDELLRFLSEEPNKFHCFIR